MAKFRNLYFRGGAVALLLSLVAFIYYLWIRADRSYAGFEMTSERSVFVTAGTYTKGNIVGIQPYMVPADYRSADALYEKLNRYLKIARSNRALTSATIVVFPEYIGTWLVAMEEKASVYTAATTGDALARVALSHPLSFASNFLRASADDKTKAALFSMKAEAMAGAYQQVFGRLAEEFNATVVAGSILLPSPFIAEGVLKTGNGPLYNISAVFSPQGTLLEPLVVKNYPTREELPFCSAGAPADLPVFSSPAGKFGVLICADSWYNTGYRTLKEQDAEILVVPSYLAGHEVWNQPWLGYNGSEPPADVAKTDTSTLTERQAWQKYAMASRGPASGFKTGVNIFLRGQLWDLGTNGNPFLIVDGTAEEIVIPAEGAAIVNVLF